MLVVTTLCLFGLVIGDKTKSLKETDDAYILEVDLPEKGNKATKTGTSTRLFTGNAAVDGAVVGLGVGVIGSLLVGKLLEGKNKCGNRGKREAPSTRFLPGILGPNNCPPPYVQPNTGYQQPNSGYQPPNSGYRPNSGYQQPTFGYQPNSGYQQPNFGYQTPSSGYQNPNTGYQRPSNGYQPANNIYHPSNYPTNSNYQPYRNHQSGYTQTSAHRATPAPFLSGLRPQSNIHPVQPLNSGYQAPSAAYQPGILVKSSPSQRSKVNFEK